MQTARPVTQIDDVLRDAGSDESAAIATDAGRMRLNSEGDW